MKKQRISQWLHGKWAFQLAISHTKLQMALLGTVFLLNAFLPYLVANSQEWLFNSLLQTQESRSILSVVLLQLFIWAILKYFSAYGLPSLTRLIDNSALCKLLPITQETINQKIIHLSYEYCMNPKVLDAKKNADETAACVWEIWKNGMGIFFAIFGIVISLSYLRPLGISCFVFFLALLVPILAFSVYAGSRYYDIWSKLAPARRKVQYYFDVLTKKETSSERIMFGYKPFFLKKWESEFQFVRKTSIREEFKGAILVLCSSALLCIYVSLLLGYGITLVHVGTVTIAYITSLFTILPTVILTSVKSISSQINNFLRNWKQCRAISSIYAYEETDRQDHIYLQELPIFEKIEFYDVSFRYPGTDEMVLEHVSFTCEAGKHYAFVGSNGSGKSTLIKLLLRLYQVTSGEIRINEKNINSMSRSEINAYVCAIFQDYTKYLTTIRENIGMGDLEKINNNKTLDWYTSISGARMFIHDLPNLYDTKLGKQRQGGVDLSGGEWQKLALTRLLLSPSPVKILDEPTAAMDPEAENQLYHQYLKIMDGKTTIFISHRLASTALSDYIYVLKEKTIVERGTHEQLMQLNGGVYQEMYTRQSKLYFDLEGGE